MLGLPQENRRGVGGTNQARDTCVFMEKEAVVVRVIVNLTSYLLTLLHQSEIHLCYRGSLNYSEFTECIKSLAKFRKSRFTLNCIIIITIFEMRRLYFYSWTYIVSTGFSIELDTTTDWSTWPTTRLEIINVGSYSKYQNIKKPFSCLPP